MFLYGLCHFLIESVTKIGRVGVTTEVLRQKLEQKLIFDLIIIV